MSQCESHFSPYIELCGSSALGPAIPYARGLKTTKLEKRKALNISILLMSNIVNFMHDCNGDCCDNNFLLVDFHENCMLLDIKIWK